MKQLYRNDYYKVIEVTLNDGEVMPQHKATSDAFILVKEGTGKIIFSDNEIELQQGSTFMIPANKEHRLQVHEAFNACIIFAPEAEIKFL
ncbi:MAG: cupin domain-containing protein [Ginsengibacter sp.]